MALNLPKNISVNSWGQIYLNGVANPTLWLQISAQLQKGDKSIIEIAEECKCSVGLVEKVRHRNESGECLPKSPKSRTTKFLDVEKLFLKEAIDTFQFKSAAEVNSQLKEFDPNLPQVSTRTILNYLKSLDAVKKQPVYEHPKKFNKKEKVEYYEIYSKWVLSLNPLLFSQLKFFDEAQVAKTDQGKFHLWTLRDHPHLVEHLKKSEKTEHYTILGITLLDNSPPIHYKIISGASNAKIFTSFVESWIAKLRPHDKVIGDNLNYHVQGQTGEFTNWVIKSLKGKYYRLPAYSPEFNPIELVWGFLKTELNKLTIRDELLPAVKRVLNLVTSEMIMKMYLSCGY